MCRQVLRRTAGTENAIANKKELDCMEVLGEWVPAHRPPDLSSLPPKAAPPGSASCRRARRRHPEWRPDH